MSDRTFIILVALAMASLGASVMWRPERYYVAPGRKEPDESVEPPKRFKIAVRCVGAAAMIFGVGMMALVFFKIRS